MSRTLVRIVVTLYMKVTPFCLLFVSWFILRYISFYCGPVSTVGIAIDYGLDGLGSNLGGGRDFPPVQTSPGAHQASCKVGTGSFPAVKCGRGVLLTTHHPLLVPRSWKSRAIPLYPPSGLHRACNGINLPLPFTYHFTNF